MTNAEKVRLFRQRRLMTQAHLAEASGLSLKTVKRLERGDAVSFETLRSVGSVLEVSFGEIGGDTPTSVPGSTPPGSVGGMHGLVHPSNEAASVLAAIHPGPDGFVSVSPDVAFLVTRRRYGRDRIERYPFGRPMTPFSDAHAVVGADDLLRAEIERAIREPSCSTLPVYSLTPPAASRSVVGTAFLARLGFAASVVSFLPMFLLVLFSLSESLGSIDAGGIQHLGSVLDALTETNWIAQRGNAEHMRPWQGPDEFMDRYLANRNHVGREMGR